MIREHLFKKRAAADPLFRWRGGDVSRVESLSDGVFAFALALIVVSLTVPVRYSELWLTVKEFPVFAVCFAILMFVWYEHYLFFRRYGLEDGPTVALNTALLFLVLFYVVPLRFTFWWLIGGLLGLDVSSAFEGLEGAELREARKTMMILFSAGWTAVYGLFLLLHLHARRVADQLELDELERYLTTTSITGNLTMMGIGFASLALTIWVQPGFGGVIFFLTGPLAAVHGWVRGRGSRLLHEQLASRATGATEPGEGIA